MTVQFGGFVAIVHLETADAYHHEHAERDSDAPMSASEQACCVTLIGSTAGGTFSSPLRPRANKLEQLLPHAPFEFLGERDTFDLHKAAANAPLARSTPT
ncbi:hypothetical protein P171DRAFT_489504 [Karstenula rhodostoma CBS 690.94]|uniref:Uncharacterized protein n=1 Tax=Karstenula rhodostoma CBS 690.94 TaxID=1392251 RepID=A0A9P4P9F4_9PLEO|nr:hypothetical protein P171DRAFT_489504 [Karstenula rhodostoma CBS 690.94]